MFNKLQCIGDGGCFAPDLKANSWFFIHNDTLVLLECNYDTFKAFLSQQVTISDDITDIIICISHTHEDHIGGLASFLYWLEYVKHFLLTHVSIISKSKQDLIKYLELTYVPNLYSNSLSILEGPIIIINEIMIKVYPEQHVPGMNCCGFLFSDTSNDLSQYEFYYTGDTSCPNKEIIRLFNEDKIKYLLAEVTFYKNDVHTHYSWYINHINTSRFKDIRFCHFDSGAAKEKIELSR